MRRMVIDEFALPATLQGGSVIVTDTESKHAVAMDRPQGRDGERASVVARMQARIGKSHLRTCCSHTPRR